MTLLQIDALSLSTHKTAILSDVSLTVQPGEIVAVTGESGSGKSMTALSVMQLLPDQMTVTGKIQLDGTDLLAASEAEMCGLRGNAVGMVFQEPMTALNPVKTIGDQVAETILVHGAMPRAQAKQRVRQNLGHLARRVCPHGQWQRCRAAPPPRCRPQCQSSLPSPQCRRQYRRGG